MNYIYEPIFTSIIIRLPKVNHHELSSSEIINFRLFILILIYLLIYY